MKPMHPDDTHQREENRARPARAMWHPAASLLNVGLAAALVTSACTSAPAATTPSAAPAASANAPSAAAGDPLACATTQGETIAIADAKLIIESVVHETATGCRQSNARCEPSSNSIA